MEALIRKNDPHEILFKKSSKEFLELQKKGIKYSKTNIANNEIVVFFDPDSVYEVLFSKKDFFIKSVWQIGLKRLLGEGLITSEGLVHLQEKRILSPAFNKESMEEYVSTIFNFVNEEIDGWEEGELSVYEKIVELCLRVAMINFFGKESLKYSSELLERIESLLRRPASLDSSKLKISFMAKQRENIDGVLKIFQKIIEEERASEGKGNNFLKILLNQKQNNESGFSDKKIKDHMATILFAGHGTVSMLLSWIIFSIANNPESMRDLKEEAKNSAWTKNNRGPTIEEVIQSKTSYQIVLEGLRMYPPVWNLPRQAIEDVYIQDVFVPKGMTVILSSYASHRNEKYYKDPESWNPKRWTREFESSLPKGSYFPFGMSTRKCLGAEFGILESQIIILCLAKKYKWKNYPENANPEISPSLSLRPKNGIPVFIEKDSS